MKPAFLKCLVLAIALLGICSSDSVAQESAATPVPGVTSGRGASASGASAPDVSSTATSNPSQQPPAAQSGGGANDYGKNNSQNQASGTSKDRLFYALPNFLTLENASTVEPLTTGEKFKVVARGTFDPVEFFWYGLLSGISQAENSEPGFKQGAAGFGKRYATAFADNTIENFWTSSIFPSLLHQDPRFFQSSKGGFWRRAGYAVSRIFVTRTDSGHTQFNYSEFLGSAVGAGISNYTYHPRSDRTLSNTVSVWGTQVSYDTLTIVIKEFWPDIRRALHPTKLDRNP